MNRRLSHYDASGAVEMVDVSGKTDTARTARASARVLMSAETIEAVKTQTNPKGNPLEIARIAGIMAAKQTSNLIPLCHQLPLSKVDVAAEMTGEGVYLESFAKTFGKTGVEMEALTAVTVAALTVYDMCKAVQKDIIISDIKLIEKTGGKSDFQSFESKV